MKNFFVIGDKASKSLSPLIFNNWYKKYNIQAKYSFLEVTKKNFNTEVVKKLNDKNTQGLNVTTPFKKDIIKYLDNKNVHAKKIGAVNCVTVGKKIKNGNKGKPSTLKKSPLIDLMICGPSFSTW